jgi:hypothetical protein
MEILIGVIATVISLVVLISRDQDGFQKYVEREAEINAIRRVQERIIDERVELIVLEEQLWEEIQLGREQWEQLQRALKVNLWHC